MDHDLTPEKLTGGRKLYGPGTDLPGGAVPVGCRTLARYSPPGAVALPHGVPPIAHVSLPDGWVISDLDDDGLDEIRVLPFRYPWYSRAYGLFVGTLCAVMRNIQPNELRIGQWATVQFNESRDWTAAFGIISKAEVGMFTLTLPSGTEIITRNEGVHFVGKVAAWWSESAVDLA